MIGIIIIDLLLVLFGKVGVFVLVFVLRVIVFSCNNLCCDVVHKLSSVWRLCIFSKFCKKCTDVSYVAGEGVELTLHKESGVVQEIEEVQLRSSYNRIGLQPRGHAPSRLPVKKLRRLLHKKRKVLKGVCMKGYPEKYHF